MSRRAYGHNKNEVIGDRRKMHKEELYNLFSSPYIIRIIISRRVKWTKHVVRIGDNVNKFLEKTGMK
jgi:hypothetical protein